MTDYDFSTINDKEFENISIDLVSIDKKKRFERFKGGRDGGIDGRFYSNNGTQEVIQCKHYLGTGFSGLISSLKKKNTSGVNEIDKVLNLNPEKYIFTTSLPLSASNKKTIKDLFQPYIKNDNDIYGQEDLNDILSKNSSIEEKYYKLWISSTTVLRRIYNNAINGRSESLIEDIKDNAKFYVITDNHNEALKKINETNILIIAGEPGIGKTTLAEHIALYFIEKNFEFYDIENSINEAENIFDSEKKQIFYFDDFLGSNYLEAIESKKDSQIVKFIKRIQKDKNKKFILTSRTNILNQAISLSDKFSTKNIRQNEFVIKINSLTEIDKARILYNHIYHNNLDKSYCDVICRNKNYNYIIKHRNFNPRIIEFISNIDEDTVTSSDYLNYIQDKLNNPEEIWKNTFDKQSDEFNRTLVFLTVFNGNKIEENILIDSYQKYIRLNELQNYSNVSKSFDSIIEEIVKYFLHRTNREGIIEYSLFNPSIADFVINKYINKLVPSILCLETLYGLKNLEFFYKRNRITDIEFTNTLLSLYESININSFVNSREIDYIIKLISIFIENNLDKKINTEKIPVIYEKIINCSLDFTLVKDFTNSIIFFNIDFQNKSCLFKQLCHLSDIDDEDDINSIIKLFNLYSLTDIKIIEQLNNLVVDSLINSLQYRLEDLEVNEFEDSDFTYQYNEEGEVIGLFDVYINESDFLEEYIANIESFKGLKINESNIIYNIDMQTIKDLFIQTFERKMGISTRIQSKYNNDSNKDIDDLFNS